MNLSFENFQFDSQQQILIKDGEVVPLNAKQTQLLALFLSDVNKIHSKSDILEKVWQDRVVTDQVIFQNINHLRRVCGTDAIKTFPKKGYQWQLSLVKINHITVSQLAEEVKTVEQHCELSKSDLEKTTSLNHSLSANNQSDYLKYGIVVVLFVILSLVTLFFNLSAENSLTSAETKQFQVTLIPNSQIKKVTDAEQIDALLVTFDDLELRRDSQLTSQSLFDSPFKTWQALSNTDGQILLSYKLYSLASENKNEPLLRFYLQGKYRGWEGNILGQSNESVAKQLNLLLKTLQSSSYFFLESNNSALAQLTLLLNTEPNNPLLKRQLIRLHYELGNYDIAAALVDSELSLHPHKVFIGVYQLLKSQIFAKQGNWQSARVHSKRSIEIFEQLNTTHLASLALIQASWGVFRNKEYRLSREYLNAAVNKARVALEPLQEIKAHLTQSFMAAKTGQEALEHSQLDLAKRLIELHQLNDEHQIFVLSNLAGSTRSKSEKISYYQQIINSPFSTLYQYEFYLAAEYVRKELIKQKEYQKVIQSIKSWQRLSFIALTRAKVEFAKEQWQIATAFAVDAFNSARISHQNYDALDASLLLIQIEGQLTQGYSITEYIDYISQNSSKRWRRINKEALHELSYWQK